MKVLIAVILVFMSLTSFFICLENFKKSDSRTIDEIVYWRIGQQLKCNLADYNSIPYAKKLMAEGRKLPPYFTQPIFKHPPLFPFLISFSLRFFGDSIIFAEYISLFFGISIIPLTYLLGTSLLGRRVGLLAAVFVALDPIQIICSQKVWMETTLSFFMLLSVWLFMEGIRRNKTGLFILSGVAAGLATLTKYPGILVIVGIAGFAAIYRRDLFRNKNFLLGLIMPLVLSLPWFYWNYRVYGLQFLSIQKRLHSDTDFLLSLSKTLTIVTLSLVVAVGLFLLARKIRHSRVILPAQRNLEAAQRWKTFVVILAGGFLVFLLRKHIFRGLQIDYLPVTTSFCGVLSRGPFYFYFGRLLEFSFIYFFAFLSFFIFDKNTDRITAILKIEAMIILLFFTAWGNFQSRYILSSLPFLIILAADVLIRIFDVINRISGFLLRYAMFIAAFIVIFMFILKIVFINVFVSFSNQFVYF